MHVLIVSTYFEPDQGATSLLLSRLARDLHRRGHQITVLTTLPHYPLGRIHPDYRGKWVVSEDRDGIRVIQTWLWATPSPRISRKLISQLSFMVTATLRGLALPRPDVTLIEAQPIFTNLAGVCLSRLKRTPYILNISDLWPDHLLTVGKMTETHPIYRTARWLVDATYRGATSIVAASPTWAEAIQRYIGPSDKFRVIYYGTDVQRLRPGHDASAFRQKYSFSDEILITFIGTFATQYDFPAMLSVAEHFKSRQDVRFVFLGDGSQSSWLRERLGRGDLSNVFWFEWIDYTEIPLAWAASHLTYWAMRDQGLYRGTIPAKLYEAMASGVPIVAATEGVAADLINEANAGITVPFSDAEGIVRGIERLLADETLRQQMSRSGRAYAEVHFAYDRTAEAYEQALCEVAKR
jgi:glycosyltransferase involved in cell wall biosynthesis